MDQFFCPKCGASYSNLEKLLGKKVKCHQCEHIFTVSVEHQSKPAPSAAVPAAPDSVVSSVSSPQVGPQAEGEQVTAYPQAEPITSGSAVAIGTPLGPNPPVTGSKPKGHLRVRPKPAYWLIALSIGSSLIFPILAYIALFVLSLFAGVSVMLEDEQVLTVGAIISLCLFVFLYYIIPNIFFTLWIYQMWKVVPPRYRSLSPMLVFCLLWVPGVAYLWQFFALPVLSWNQRTIMRKSNASEVMPTIGFILALFFAMLDLLGLFVLVLNFVFFLFLPVSPVMTGIYGYGVILIKVAWMVLTNITSNNMLKELYPQAQVRLA